jgi:predicted RNA-binding protein YlqC (UPF0109 family)
MDSSEVEDVQALFEDAVASICRHPEQLQVRWQEQDDKIYAEVDPFEEDFKAVNGYRGRHSHALRILFELAFAQLNLRFYLQVIDSRKRR